MQDEAFPEYPFVGIPAVASEAREIRFYVARRYGQLTNEYIRQLISLPSRPSRIFDAEFIPAEICFTHEMLSGPLSKLAEIPVEVFQSLIELRGGLSSVRGSNFINDLVNEIKGRFLVYRPQHLTLLPPSEALRNLDDGLYRRSLALYRYTVMSNGSTPNEFDKDWNPIFSTKHLADEQPLPVQRNLQKQVA